MATHNYEYETKCRRCGKLTDWHFSSGDQLTWVEFANAMADHIKSPRTHNCKKCEKETVQDVVSFTPLES